MDTNWSDPRSMVYHLDQYKTQKDSTRQFANFICSYVKDHQKIIDLGTGAGAALSYLASIYKKSTFLGVDADSSLIEEANNFLSVNADGGRIRFQTGDFYDLREFGIPSPDGVISLQTLSWLSDFRSPMEQVYNVLQPEWIALTSLFYEGSISAETVITEHKRSRRTFYNTISLPEFEEFANRWGYKIDKIEKYKIDIDLPKPPDSDLMGTYTEFVSTKSGRERIQISGPLLMNWYFVGLVKSS